MLVCCMHPYTRGRELTSLHIGAFLHGSPLRSSNYLCSSWETRPHLCVKAHSYGIGGGQLEGGALVPGAHQGSLHGQAGEYKWVQRTVAEQLAAFSFHQVFLPCWFSQQLREWTKQDSAVWHSSMVEKPAYTRVCSSLSLVRTHLAQGLDEGHHLSQEAALPQRLGNTGCGSVWRLI
jgi:hypothetical protein